MNYFTTTGALRFTDITNRYNEREADARWIMDDFTDMPMDFIDNYLVLSSYELINGITVDDVKNWLTDNGFDAQHIAVFMDIEFESNKYMLLLNKETGHGNLRITHDDLTFFSEAKIPVNFDFDVPDHNHQYKSIYPRLKQNSNVLKLNDIFYAKIDLATVIGFKNIKWKVYNNITGELLYEHSGYSLKYRVTNKYIFDVELSFEINSNVNTIYKEKCFSAFGVVLQ